MNLKVFGNGDAYMLTKILVKMLDKRYKYKFFNPNISRRYYEKICLNSVFMCCPDFL